jgi:predicted RNA-binding Zn-ribbon protein involved in translation (DUF1610 family)
MKITCAWCKKSLGQKEPLTDARVSHTICPACFERMIDRDAEARKAAEKARGS